LYKAIIQTHRVDEIAFHRHVSRLMSIRSTELMSSTACATLCAVARVVFQGRPLT